MLGAVAYLFLLTLFYALSPEIIHRHDFDRAFVSWRKEPNPRNEATLRVQQRKNTIVQLEMSAVLAPVMWAAGFAYCGIICRGRV
jgi:hypothetical protein